MTLIDSVFEMKSRPGRSSIVFDPLDTNTAASNSSSALKQLMNCPTKIASLYRSQYYEQPPVLCSLSLNSTVHAHARDYYPVVKQVQQSHDNLFAIT